MKIPTLFPTIVIAFQITHTLSAPILADDGSELAKRQDVQTSGQGACVILSVNGQTQSFGDCDGLGSNGGSIGGNGNGGTLTGGRTGLKGVHRVASVGNGGIGSGGTGSSGTGQGGNRTINALTS